MLGPSPTNADGGLAIRDYRPEDEARVLAILQDAFASWPPDLRVSPSAFFRWKHALSPFGPSRMLAAEADGAVVGFWAFMPWLVGFEGATLKTVRSGDLAVDRAYRRRGVSMALRAAARFDEDSLFTWSHGNSQGRPGAVKAGWREVGPFTHYVHPCRTPRETIGRVRSRGSRSPGELVLLASTAAEVLAEGAYTEHLLAGSVDPRDRLATVKDLEFLRCYGHFQEYHAIAADPGRGEGVVIFRPRRHGHLWALEVCELLVAEDNLATARHLLEQVRRSAAADLITCNFQSRRRAALCGFVPGRGTNLTINPLRPDLEPDPTLRASWCLSRGDLELL